MFVEGGEVQTQCDEVAMERDARVTASDEGLMEGRVKGRHVEDHGPLPVACSAEVAQENVARGFEPKLHEGCFEGVGLVGVEAPIELAQRPAELGVPLVYERRWLPIGVLASLLEARVTQVEQRGRAKLELVKVELEDDITAAAAEFAREGLASIVEAEGHTGVSQEGVASSPDASALAALEVARGQRGEHAPQG